MKYWNSRLKQATEYIPGEQPEDYDAYIKLNTNENPFSPSKEVLESLKKACNENLRFYPDSTASKVRESFAKENNISSENIFVANGSDEIFTLLFRGFIEPTGLAAFPYPSYSLYYTLAEMNGIKFEKVQLGENFSYNLKEFQKKKYDMIIIANPNNPTGTYCEIEQIKKFLPEYKGLLVVDEAYVDFFGGSSLELIKKYDNVIVTRSFSKSYSLAGLRMGLAIANKDIIRGFQKIKDSYNIDTLAQVAAMAAIKDKKAFEYNITMMKNNKEYLEERLQGLEFEIIPSRANFVFVKHPAISAAELYARLKEKKILIRYFTGARQSEYVRISVGTMMEIKTLCKELGTIVGA